MSFVWPEPFGGRPRLDFLALIPPSVYLENIFVNANFGLDVYIYWIYNKDSERNPWVCWHKPRGNHNQAVSQNAA
jgi:hypothetical protein